MSCKHDWEYLKVISKEEYLNSKSIMSDEIFNKFKIAVWSEVYRRGVNLQTIHADFLHRKLHLPTLTANVS